MHIWCKCLNASSSSEWWSKKRWQGTWKGEREGKKANIRCINDRAIAAGTLSLLANSESKCETSTSELYLPPDKEAGILVGKSLSAEGFSIESLILAQLIDYEHVKHSLRKPSGQKQNQTLALGNPAKI